MKKYLMSAIAVVTMGAAFTSCSHNFDVYNGEDEKKVEKETYSAELVQAEYEAIFQQTFGKPAADQDWGFGDSSAATRAFTRSNMVVTGDPFTYESTDGYYIEDVKETDYPNLSAIANTDQNTECIVTSDFPTSTNFWGGEHTFYIKGDVTIPSDAYIANAKIYVLKGSTLTMNKTANNETVVYVADGATLKLGIGKIETNQEWGKDPKRSRIYNNGTVELPSDFKVSNDAVFYNEGNVTGVDLTSAPADGNPSFFYNYGDLHLTGKMVLNSTAHFFNEGTVRVDGETSVSKNGIYWINKGHYTTGTMTFSAHNETFYNFCNLTVLGKFTFYDGKFNLMDNSYTEAASADFGHSHFEVHMGNNSGININGNVSFAANGDGTDQGFFTTGSKAYVRINGKATVAEHKNSFIISGNIVYAIKDGIDDLGKDNTGVQPTYQFKNGAKAVEDFSKLNVTPKEEDCGADWEEEETEPTEVRVICEDLFANSGSDFDFNDLVFDVIFGDPAKIIIRAAGGTLPIYINDTEIHALMGYATLNEKGQLPMLNTGADAKGLYGVDNAGTKELELGVAINKRSEIPSKITITVEKGSTLYTLVNNNNAASMICVGTDFEPWMGERDKLVEKYPKFDSFVKTKKPAWNEWYK